MTTTAAVATRNVRNLGLSAARASANCSLVVIDQIEVDVAPSASLAMIVAKVCADSWREVTG